MIVRELLAKFGVSFDDSGAKKADKAVTGLSSGLQSLIGLVGGAALVRGFGHFILQQVELADAVGDTADRIGIGIEALQELRFVGQDVGVSMEGVDGALARLARGSAEAAKGQGEAKDAFAEMGVQLKDSSGNLRSVDDILNQVADGLGNAKSDADRLRLGFAVFGREGSKFAATMKNGSAGVEEMRQKARELGGVLSKEQVDAADKADKAINAFALALGGLKHQIATEVIPALTQGLGKLTRWVAVAREVVGNSNILAGAFAAVGVALATMIGAEKLLMLTKAGIAFGLIALAIDELKTWSEGGNTLIGRLIDKFNGLGASATILENWKVGLKLVAEYAESFYKNLVAGWEVMQKLNAQRDAEKHRDENNDRRRQFDSEHASWERRKKFNQEHPGLPNAFKYEVGPEPVLKLAGESGSDFEELRTRQVASGRGTGQGPLALPGGAESMEDHAREQYRQAEAVRVASEKSAAGPVNVHQNVTVNVQGGGDSREAARLVEHHVRKALNDQNGNALRAHRQVPP